ncbi:MAG: hypothetical protein RLZ04_1987 [Actinomycetota bacterium]
MRVLVVTCSASGDDARIVHREARTLLERGHEVVLVSEAPARPDDDPRGLERVAIPRARGRRRVASWRAARAAVCRLRPACDLMLIHDPELVPVLLLRRSPVPVVWDVREDYVASVADRRWIPSFARRAVRRTVRGIYALASRRCHLILAEDSYVDVVADAPVIPNSTWVPEEVPPVRRSAGELPEVVYVGRLSVGRGALEMVALGRLLRGEARVVLIGAADGDVEAIVRGAHDEGVVEWTGPLPNPVALARVDGALAGLSLLHPLANYVHSRPTKLLEYSARGVPCISTPLPLAAEAIERTGAGVVTPHGDVDAVAVAVRRLLADVDLREEWGRRVHADAVEHYNWQRDGARFESLLAGWAGR